MTVSSDKDKVSHVRIKPTSKECKVMVNGAAITGETDLDHNDRIVVGSTHIWIFQVRSLFEVSTQFFLTTSHEGLSTYAMGPWRVIFLLLVRRTVLLSLGC